MQSRGEDAALLEDTDWTLDLAFLTDITGKRNSLNWELQGKESTITNGFQRLDCYAKRAAHLQSQLQRRMIRRARLMETDVTKLLGLFNSDTEEDDFMGFSQEDESDL
ncbi:hypothetical protein D4764_11G0000390 [Takifugu flavidus]|uniref:Uncharacterized protein n=1 Tax=Takifugu flavidus TaxID=433684 RepID=A0A5C6PGW8_9TELE|nr:hypothetical protein D4764_11G0000390 [Takifugu flavidus]